MPRPYGRDCSGWRPGRGGATRRAPCRLESSFADANQVPFERDASHDGAGVALEVGLAGVFLLAEIADDIGDGIGAGLVRSILELDQGRLSCPDAGFFVFLRKSIAFLVGDRACPQYFALGPGAGQIKLDAAVEFARRRRGIDGLLKRKVDDLVGGL